MAIGASGIMAANTTPFVKKTQPSRHSDILTPEKSSAKVKQQASPQGAVLFEDFESWDGTEGWQPEGWSFIHKLIPDGHPGWRVYGPSPYDPVDYPSNTYIFPEFKSSVDEWLITPEFTVQEGMIFAADCYNGGTYYYDMEVVDKIFDNTITKIEIKNDFIIHITTDNGATWTKLYSIPEEMLTRGYTRAGDYWNAHGWETITIDLADYVGETAKIAFQIVGEPESNASGVDNIKVGYPSINLSYGRPASALFFGQAHPEKFIPATLMVVPVHRPVTFENTSESLGSVAYSWEYETTEGDYTASDKSLTVTYGTNHESESTSRNNIYKMPVLTGSGEFLTTTQFSLPGLLQAGGKGEYEVTTIDDNGIPIEKEVNDFGLVNADHYTEGTQTYAALETPYFGYNAQNDRYWTGYQYPEKINTYNPDDETNWRKLERIANLYYTSEAPIAIEGIRLPAYGRGFNSDGSFSPDTKLTAEIYILGEDMKVPEKPAYTAVCQGEDLQWYDRYASNHILTCNFRFDAPVVISDKDGKAFLVAVTGFHDADNIDYFSPELTAYDNPEGLELGYYQTRINHEGDEFLQWDSVYSHTSSRDYTRGGPEPEGCRKVTFMMILDAAYTWIESESDEVVLQANVPAEVALDTFHDGSQIEIDGLPAWLDARATGRYGDAKLTLKATENTNAEAVITLKAPGAGKSIKVIAGSGSSAIEGIGTPESDGVATYYNLQGIRVENPQSGQLLIKVVNGKSTKMIL